MDPKNPQRPRIAVYALRGDERASQVCFALAKSSFQAVPRNAQHFKENETEPFHGVVVLSSESYDGTPLEAAYEKKGIKVIAIKTADDLAAFLAWVESQLEKTVEEVKALIPTPEAEAAADAVDLALMAAAQPADGSTTIPFEQVKADLGLVKDDAPPVTDQPASEPASAEVASVEAVAAEETPAAEDVVPAPDAPAVPAKPKRDR